MIIAKSQKTISPSRKDWIFYDDSCLLWQVSIDTDKQKCLILSGPVWWSSQVIDLLDINKELKFLRKEDLEELNDYIN